MSTRSSFSHADSITERQTINLEEDSDLQLDFGLVAGYLGDPIPIEVSGVVRKQDKLPLANALVTVENVFSRRLVYKGRTAMLVLLIARIIEKFHEWEGDGSNFVRQMKPNIGIQRARAKLAS